MQLVSNNLVNFVKGFEGFSPIVYKDCVGVNTLGYGMTGALIKGLSDITEEQATTMLSDLLNNNYADPIKNDLNNKGVVLTQNEFDSLVSMAYNIGVGGLLSSTLYKFVVRGIKDIAIITSNFQSWSMAGGQRVEGLYRRRTEEAEMFFRNDNILKVVNELKKIVIYLGDADLFAAVMVAQKNRCPLMLKSDFEASGLTADEIVQIGGKPNSTRFTTFKDAATLI